MADPAIRIDGDLAVIQEPWRNRIALSMILGVAFCVSAPLVAVLNDFPALSGYKVLGPVGVAFILIILFNRRVTFDRLRMECRQWRWCLRWWCVREVSLREFHSVDSTYVGDFSEPKMRVECRLILQGGKEAVPVAKWLVTKRSGMDHAATLAEELREYLGISDQPHQCDRYF